MDDKSLIEKFESKHKDIVIAYGGDGTLLKVAAETGDKKAVIPVRDYARCAKHKDLLAEICTGKDMKHALKHEKAPWLEARFNDDDDKTVYKGIAEIVLKSFDPTEALRFSVIVNGKTYMKQCIADGIIYASKLGSHGYFKSVTRTLFTDNDSVGLGFIAPTYGICNLVLKSTDNVLIKFERPGTVVLSHDKRWKTVNVLSGTEVELTQSCEGVSLFGYDLFCCQECRNLRNSTTVNDKYIS